METKYPREIIKTHAPAPKEKEVIEKPIPIAPRKAADPIDTPDEEAQFIIPEKEIKENLEKNDKKIEAMKIPIIKSAIESPKDIIYVPKHNVKPSFGEITEKLEDIPQLTSRSKPENAPEKVPEVPAPNNDPKIDNNSLPKKNVVKLPPLEKPNFPNMFPDFDFSFLEEKRDTEKFHIDTIREKQKIVDQLIEEFNDI
mmetsp:Transcript_27608/g.27296  ORF Transcript_27608/g.27296 Transcript_27608/m.27296 type:complete len:198 (+) Transcript_27608:1-594(+)